MPAPRSLLHTLPAWSIVHNRPGTKPTDAHIEKNEKLCDVHTKGIVE